MKPQNRALINRRHFLNLAGMSGISLMVWNLKSALALAEPTLDTLSPDAALKRLLAGNQRFVRQEAQHPDQAKSRLKAVAQAQHPFATILSCADSRVAPEILFDEGIGDLFDIRVAGNIVTPEVLGSLEYAAVLLKCPLLVILGHERCGAVTAAVKAESVPGHISTFVKAIEPAVKRVQGKPGDPVENAVIVNVQYQIEQLKQQSDLIAQRAQQGKLKIVGARYDLDTGEVSLIG